MIEHTFRSMIKSSLFVVLLGFRQCTTQETPECVDSGTNSEQLPLPYMRTQLKFEQNTWTRKFFKIKHVDSIKLSILLIAQIILYIY